ncbi:Baculoviral IAP repeat-containing protein 2, partial [Eschrichtius robustus]|nr:Baculoviral IAP repeat-containing protein 2 [Eschrichtius robustus]
MQTHAARLRTFMYWPSTVPVQPEQLASAGFYYVGRSDDVKCFCCDGGLRCWESGDDPWVEHAKWFPRQTNADFAAHQEEYWDSFRLSMIIHDSNSIV